MAVKERIITRADAPVALPEGWRKVKFGDVVRNVDVAERNPLEKGLERYVGLDHLEPESLHIKRWGLIEEGTSFTRKFIKGQVLFGKRRAYQRKAAVAEFDGICSGDILVFEPKSDDLIHELLPFIVQSDSFYEKALGTSAGSLSPRTKWKDLAGYEFLLPPKDKQRRFADLLWVADENVQARENVLTEIINLRQLVIDDLLSDTNEGSVVALREICEMQNGRPFPSSDYQSSGLKLLRPGNLGSDGYFYWGKGTTKFLPEEYMQTAADFLVEEDDVVINLTAQSLEDGFMGRVCIARDGDTSLLNQRIGRFRCSERIDPEYLFRCLQTSQFRRLVETSCEGSKIRHLYWRHIEGFMIPLPSKKEQKHLIAAVASMDTAIRTARVSILDSCRLSIQLRETLLSSN